MGAGAGAGAGVGAGVGAGEYAYTGQRRGFMTGFSAMGWLRRVSLHWDDTTLGSDQTPRGRLAHYGRYGSYRSRSVRGRSSAFEVVSRVSDLCGITEAELTE